MKLTLDTNCVINLFDSASSSRTSVGALNELVRAALANEVSLAITTRVERDVVNDRDEKRRAEMLERLAMFPVIGSVLRVGVSTISRDFVVGGESQAIEAEVRGILAPGLAAGGKRVRNSINDIDHVVGHVINRRDIFITDDRGILRNAEALRRSVGAVVMSPQECVDFLANRAATPDPVTRSPTAETATRQLDSPRPAAEQPTSLLSKNDIGDPDAALAAMVEELKGSDLERSARTQATCDLVLSTIKHIVDREIVLHLSNIYVSVQSNYHSIPGGSHSEIGIARRDNIQNGFMRKLDVVVAGSDLTIFVDGEPMAHLNADAPDLGGEPVKRIRANYLSGLQELQGRR